jgi:uncharacterized metal-binding protein YceD (DUF177 family)
MSEPAPTSDTGAPAQTHRLRIADLPKRKPTRFDLRPSPTETETVCRELGLSGLRKLRLTGQIAPIGKSDWRLTAELGATVVQPCVVTLDPVTTRIDEAVERAYVADWQDPETAEAEMPEDTATEPVPPFVDLMAVLSEALTLALPLYPRADGVELGPRNYTEPGKAPMTDEDARPFAGLAKLKLIKDNE